MIPILSTNTTLTGQGLGRLSEALSCIVTHEVNGMYELVMQYPVTGERYGNLANDRIIWADADNYTKQQGFRIYRITKPLNGIVTVYARHLCYDMSGYVCQPMNQSSLTTALAALAGNCVPAGCPFTFTSTRTVATAYKTATPMSLWQMMGGVAGSLLDIYGGEWDFDNYTATLRTRLGSDRGMSIRYGKNMTDLEQDASIEAQYGGIFPFWYDETTGTLVTLPENYVTVAGGGSRVLCIDFTEDFETQPTVSQLRSRANAYATANKVGEASISWKVCFVPLRASEEYKNIGALDDVKLGDTVSVYYEPMNLTASARAVKTEYNVLLDRFETVTLGRVKQNLAKIVVDQKKEMEHTVTVIKSTLEKAIDQATDFITNGAGYMRFIYDANDELTEIVSLDNADIAQAASVWRWNNGGFGHSSTGYNGQYTTAITQNGAIVADFITAGTLNANIIRAGIIADTQGNNSWNLATGELETASGKIGRFTITSTNLHAWEISGDDTTCVGMGGNKAFWAGAYNSNSAPFRVSYSGVLYATGANISGTFAMTGGSINVATNSETDDVITLNFSTSTINISPGILDMVGAKNYAQIWGSQGIYTAGRIKNGTRYTTTNLNSGVLKLGGSGGETTPGLQYNGVIEIRTGSDKPFLVFDAGGTYSATGMPVAAAGINIGDGSSSYWRTELTNDGLVFRNSSNTVTGTYPNTGLGVPNLNGCQVEEVETNSTAKTYTLTRGTYLLVANRYSSTTTTADGVWLVTVNNDGTGGANRSHLIPIVTGSSSPSPSITNQTLSVSTTSTYMRFTLTKLSN